MLPPAPRNQADRGHYQSAPHMLHQSCVVVSTTLPACCFSLLILSLPPPLIPSPSLSPSNPLPSSLSTAWWSQARPCPSASPSSPHEAPFQPWWRRPWPLQEFIFFFCYFSVDFQNIFVHLYFAWNLWNFLRGFVSRIFLSNIVSISLQISRKSVRILSFSAPNASSW